MLKDSMEASSNDYEGLGFVRDFGYLVGEISTTKDLLSQLRIDTEKTDSASLLSQITRPTQETNSEEANECLRQGRVFESKGSARSMMAAIGLYTGAIELRPNCSIPYRYCYYAQIQAGQLQQALTTIKTALTQTKAQKTLRDDARIVLGAIFKQSDEHQNSNTEDFSDSPIEHSATDQDASLAVKQGVQFSAATAEERRTLLIAMRKQAEKSQNQLAQLSEINQSNISAYENGKKPISWETVVKCARALGFNLSVTYSLK